MKNILKELFTKKKLVKAEEKCKNKIVVSDVFLSRPFLKDNIGKVMSSTESILDTKGFEIILPSANGKEAYQMIVDMTNAEESLISLYKISVSGHHGTQLFQKESMVEDMVCQKLWNTIPLRECFNRILWDLAVYKNIVFIGENDKLVDQMLIQNLVDNKYAALIVIKDVEHTIIPGTTRHTVVFREHYTSTKYVVSYDIEGNVPYLIVTVANDYNRSLLFEGSPTEIVNLADQCKADNGNKELFINILNSICVEHGFKFVSDNSTSLAEKLRAFDLYRDMDWIRITPYEFTENVVKSEISYFSYFPYDIIELKKNNDDKYKSFINDAISIVSTSKEFKDLCAYYEQFGAVLKSATSIIDDNLEAILSFRHDKNPMGMFDFAGLVFKFIYKYPMKCLEFKK